MVDELNGATLERDETSRSQGALSLLVVGKGGKVSSVRWKKPRRLGVGSEILKPWIRHQAGLSGPRWIAFAREASSEKPRDGMPRLGKAF